MRGNGVHIKVLHCWVHNFCSYDMLQCNGLYALVNCTYKNFHTFVESRHTCRYSALHYHSNFTAPIYYKICVTSYHMLVTYRVVHNTTTVRIVCCCSPCLRTWKPSMVQLSLVLVMFTDDCGHRTCNTVVSWVSLDTKIKWCSTWRWGWILGWSSVGMAKILNNIIYEHRSRSFGATTRYILFLAHFI